MKYYRILPTGIKKKLALHRTWPSEEAAKFYAYFEKAAYADGAQPEGLAFTANRDIDASDISQIQACELTNINSILFSKVTSEKIRSATESIFQFVPCTVLTRDKSYVSEDFFAVRFCQQRRFFDRDRRLKYINELVTPDIHPFFETGLDFEYACQDPEGDYWVVNSDFKKLIDPIVKLKYLELDVEIISA